MCSQNDDPTTYDVAVLAEAVVTVAAVPKRHPHGGGPRRSEDEFWSTFWSRVDIKDGCWVWIGKRDGNGYGQATRPGERIAHRTHRIAYEKLVGPIPDGLSVLHRCDNPPCLRPLHLFLGTQLDNMRDASVKGRLRKRPRQYCVHGHEFTPENTRIGRNGTKRICRACSYETSRVYAEGQRRPYPSRPCQRRIWIRGEDRPCGVIRGSIAWTDAEGREHFACANHRDSMLRRYPARPVPA